MAISTRGIPSVPGIEIDKDIAHTQYRIRLDYRVIENFPGDPWIAIMDDSIRKYQGVIRKESLGKLSKEDLETLAQMIINEMDKR